MPLSSIVIRPSGEVSRIARSRASRSGGAAIGTIVEVLMLQHSAGAASVESRGLEAGQRPRGAGGIGWGEEEADVSNEDPLTPAALAGLPWHALPAAAACAALGTGPDGLDEPEALRRAARFGPNRLTPPRRRGPLARFARQFHSLLIYVLLGAGLATALLGEWVDTGVILGVVLINALIGFLQEGRAEQALAAIRDLLAPSARVVRSGRPRLVPAEDLVPGDVVLLQSGDKVPADLRLVAVKGLRIQESALTGESVAVEKATEPVAAEAALGDRRGLAYAGTLVVHGRGRGVVTATGEASEIGRLGVMLAEVQTLETPLLGQIAAFARQLTAAILGLAALTFAFGLLVRSYGAADMLLAAVGLAVAAIPEGLPAIMTITLALGVQRMARRHAIVRRLPAVETLGSGERRSAPTRPARSRATR